MSSSSDRPRTEADRWPRLSRFYGIPPSELAVLPRTIVDIYEDQILALEAEEMLVAMQVADHPHVTEKGREQQKRRLIRIAGLGEPDAIDPHSHRTEQQLGGIGIKVVRE